MNSKGSAAVEMVYVLLFLLAFVVVLKGLAFISDDSHDLSWKLQKDIEKLMVENERPVCLEKIKDKNSVSGKSLNVRKIISYVELPICGGK